MKIPGELATLQLLRLKGRASVDVLAGALGASSPVIAQDLIRLCAAGYCHEGAARYRLTPAGREHLNALLDSERAALDGPTLTGLYEAFTSVNHDYKRLIHAWQARDGAPNTHTDKAYDDEVVRQIRDLHQRFEPLLGRMIDAAPRLAGYTERFNAALGKIAGGDMAWLTRPMIDSHHTIWFELHEDLIGLAGHTRQAEAEAGRAD